MFDLVTKHKRIAQFVLALIAIPFAFVGVDYYFRRDATTAPIATVGGSEVTRAEFDELVRQQQDRMRQTMGRGLRPRDLRQPGSPLFAGGAARLAAAAAAAGAGAALPGDRRRPRARDRRDRGVPRRRQVLAGALPAAPRGAEHDARDVRAAPARGARPRAALRAARVGQHRREELRRTLRGAARAAARGGGRDRRRRALREGRQGRRRRGQGVLRPEPGGVPDARAGEDRVRDAHAAGAVGEGHGRPRRGEEAVRRQPQELLEGRGAPRLAHPGRRQARRERRRQGGREGQGRAARQGSARRPGALRRARQGELRRPGLGRAGRRPRHVRAAARW